MLKRSLVEGAQLFPAIESLVAIDRFADRSNRIANGRVEIGINLNRSHWHRQGQFGVHIKCLVI